MTVRHVLLALLIGSIFAWTLQARAQHSGAPDGASEHERCREEAHRTHCDCWVQCNAIPDEELRDKCKDMCGETEKLEMNKCDAT